jgi:DNA invertase Pin-like site-specific DNA recombinase
MTQRPPSRQPHAYSYIRFSDPSQQKGDSLRRQTETEEWCHRHGIPLDTSLSLRDLGVSAFRGKHRSDKAALGGFLRLIEQGKIPKGDYLVIENLDRLSREDERTALRLWMDILDAGVNIVQLHPETIFRHERSEMVDIIRAIIELSRGHSESLMKSKRVGDAWAEKRRRARNGEDQLATNRMGSGCKVLTRTLPAWVERRGGSLHLIPERALALKRIYQLAGAGRGHLRIIEQLLQDKVPPFGVPRWTRAYVSKLLRDRRVLGEYQPCRDRKPDGPPITDYYPQVISESEWLAARAGARQRQRAPGRIGKYIHVFTGLVRDARDGRGYHAAVRLAYRCSRCDARINGKNCWRCHTQSGKPDRSWYVLLNESAREGSPANSFPLEPFERALLSMLAEVDPRDVLGREDGPDEVAALEGEQDQVQAKIAEIQTELLNGSVAALASVLRQLETRDQELAQALEQARHKAANPLRDAWGTAQTLLGTLDAASDREDARLRFRATLRRLVSEIRLLVVRRGINQLAAVQVFFADGVHSRSYLIFHKSPRGNGRYAAESRWWARSLAQTVEAGDLDMRKPEHARRLEAALAAIDPAELTAQ